MNNSLSKHAGLAGLRLELSRGIWLLAAFICIGPFLAQGIVVATGGTTGLSLLVAGCHFVLAILAGTLAYTATHKSFSGIPSGSLVSLALAAFTYNALAVVLVRFFAITP